MVKISKKIIIKYISILVAVLISGCASQLPPGGGDVDSIPPEITFVYPVDGTTNFNDDYFELEFSEYVEKRTFKDAIFISPAIEGELDISWTGKTVTVTFPGELKEDFTYVVSVGTDVVDVNNQNRMAQTFNFSFSTGEKIDTKTISGKVFDKDSDGILIYAYRVEDDTTNYLLKKPDYVSQVGKDGRYLLKGLAESTYRVFAVKDQFRDFKFQQEQDWIGIPFQDISLSEQDSSYSKLNYYIFKVDTVKPRLISSVMTDNRHILVTLSEEFDSTIITPVNFSIIDSTNNIESGLKFAFKGNTKPEELVLVTDDTLSSQSQYFLRSDRLIDKKGNTFFDDYTPITLSNRIDTTAVKIFKTSPVDLGKFDYKESKLTLHFDDALVKHNIERAVTLSDTFNVVVPSELKFLDDATLQINPKAKLIQDKDYLLKINLSLISDPSGNKTDTTIVHRVRTISEIEFSGLTGKVISEQPDKVKVVIQSIIRPNNVYMTTLNKDMEFNFERITSDKYLLWAFDDENDNNTFDMGYPDPLKYSEKFYVYSDTLELRPRWSVTDIIFDLTK